MSDLAKIDLTVPAEQESFLVKITTRNNGQQALFRFPNGYGASVVRAPQGLRLFGGSYGHERGLWELAVLVWEGEEYELTYDTPITHDVIGHLAPEDVDELLEKIKALLFALP